MNLAITGGGTGGHLMIAQALVEASNKEGYNSIFIGSLKGQDRKYFQNSDLFKESYFLNTTGVVNQRGFGKIKALFKTFLAVIESRKILRKHKINALYSVGGFSAAPASIAALTLKIPIFIHEQNAVEGKLNKFLKPYSKSFISAYNKESSIDGYPVKDIFYKTSRVRDELKTIIFLGGSHGAKAINELALSVAVELDKKGIKIIHQSGEFDYDRVRDEYKKINIDVELYAFTKELPTLIEKADMAVSRAGASTLWELTALGLPALFIPYPYAAANHQYHNAKFLFDNDLCFLQTEDKLNIDNFNEILNSDIHIKSKQLIQTISPNGAQSIINIILNNK